MNVFQGVDWEATCGIIFCTLAYYGEKLTFTPQEIGLTDMSDLRGLLTRNLNLGVADLINLMNGMSEASQKRA